MIDPDYKPAKGVELYPDASQVLAGDLVGPYVLRTSCRVCQKESAMLATGLCASCQVEEATRDHDILLTNKVVERAERDSMYAARLKMALGL